MKRFLLSSLALLAVFCSTGCHFWKKNSKPKENPAIAADVEQGFKARWVDRRAAELAAGGASADAARQKADAEFRERYEFTGAAHK
jgi:hypothetical protein